MKKFCQIFACLWMLLLLMSCNASKSVDPLTDVSASNGGPFTLPEFTTELVAVPNGTVQTYTFRPSGDGPFPALYFLQGYPCRTIEPTHDKSQVRNRLIARYVEAGILVYMAEKPGMGSQGKTEKSCEDLTYPEEVTAFEAAFAGIAQNPDVDQDNIFLFGHSLGGQTAPLVADRHKVRGIITYGIHAKPWFEFMIDLSRKQGERLGMDPKQLQTDTALMIPFLYDLMIAKQDWKDLEANHGTALKTGIMRAEGQRLNGRDYRFWATLNDADFISAWADFDGQVLAFYGSYDIAAISSEGAERIAATVNHDPPGHARTVILEGTDHNFIHFDGSFVDYKKQRFGSDWTGDNTAHMFDPRVAEESIAWMREIAKN